MKLFIALTLLSGYATEYPMTNPQDCREIAGYIAQSKEVKDAQCMVRLPNGHLCNMLDVGTSPYTSSKECYEASWDNLEPSRLDEAR